MKIGSDFSAGSLAGVGVTEIFFFFISFFQMCGAKIQQHCGGQSFLLWAGFLCSWVDLGFAEAWQFFDCLPEGFDFVVGVFLVGSGVGMAGNFLAHLGGNPQVGEV